MSNPTRHVSADEPDNWPSRDEFRRMTPAEVNRFFESRGMSWRVSDSHLHSDISSVDNPQPPDAGEGHPVWNGTGTCPYCGVFVPAPPDAGEGLDVDPQLLAMAMDIAEDTPILGTGLRRVDVVIREYDRLAALSVKPGEST